MLLFTAVFTLLSLVAAQAADKTFVLVHGAFGDQSVWDGPDANQGVAEQLRQRNYRVVTVTLPGMGRNYAQSSEAIDLEAHIQHVLDVLELDNVTDATMVCHSYAGMVCAAVQDRAPADRINKMVFFDAVVPDSDSESGESFFDAIGMPSPSLFPSLEVFYQTVEIDPGENLWCFPNMPAQAFGLTGSDADWLNFQWNQNKSRQHCQSIQTFAQKLNFSWNNEVKKYFVHAMDGWEFYTQFDKFRERAEVLGWNMYSIPGSHYVLISDPSSVVQLLMLIDSVPYDNWPFS
jgi:pimeloyl-ACP methyl ester carboxylesterase